MIRKSFRVLVYLALGLLMISTIILGMGLPSAVCYLLMATLIGPIFGEKLVVDMGANPCQSSQGALVDHDVVKGRLPGDLHSIAERLDLQAHLRPGAVSIVKNGLGRLAEMVLGGFRQEAHLAEFNPDDGGLVVADPADGA